MSVQEQLSQAQARGENVRAEKDIIKSSEQRLLAELDSVRRERQTQTMLMANLQAIQVWTVMHYFYTEFCFVFFNFSLTSTNSTNTAR